jgi:hypothetical protein
MKLADIIKYYKGLPHQDKALEVALEIPGDLEFARIWRGGAHHLTLIHRTAQYGQH